MNIKFFLSAVELVNDEPRFAFDAIDCDLQDDRMILFADSGEITSINMREVFAYRIEKEIS